MTRPKGEWSDYKNGCFPGLPAGEQLILSGTNTEKFTKRGKGYFRHVSEARDRQGRLYVSQVNTEIIDLSRPGVPDDPDTRQGRRITMTWDESAPVGAAWDNNRRPGSRLPFSVMSFNRAQMAVFRVSPTSSPTSTQTVALLSRWDSPILWCRAL